MVMEEWGRNGGCIAATPGADSGPSGQNHKKAMPDSDSEGSKPPTHQISQFMEPRGGQGKGAAPGEGSRVQEGSGEAARTKFRLIITCAGSCRSCLFIIDGEAAVAVLPTAT